MPVFLGALPLHVDQWNSVKTICRTVCILCFSARQNQQNMKNVEGTFLKNGESDFGKGSSMQKHHKA